ncbi:unnamed protein product [Toxocara canis]|uniref:DUF4789 domain-containing protein n=1 Tax=Toxocara canis TaxID=6265 RepID=A0A183TYV4_TOXCA|nr:unnamed protein product [Toxocara canis]
MLDDYKNYKSFTECVYEVDGGEYNTSKCIEDDDEHAYMRKVYKVPCNLGGHGIYDFKVERLERFPQCSGMRGVNISSIITAQTPIYVGCYICDINIIVYYIENMSTT